MKQVVNWPLLAMTLLLLPWSANAAMPLGNISGTVKDSEGRPLAGALVKIYNPEIADEALKATTKTDKHGRFVAANISPGKYTLQAKADGYKSGLIEAAFVEPRQTSVFNFKLYRVTDLMTAEQEADSYKYVLRRNRTIFQFERDADELVAEKKVFVPQTHGVVNFAATQSLSAQPGAASFAGFNFALAQTVNNSVELVVSGQAGLGSVSPQRIETQASVLAGDNHQFNFTIGYGHIPTFDSGPLPTGATGLNQYSVRVTDSWHIAGPIVILYGFDYSRFEGTTTANKLSPRFNIDYQLSGRDQLFAAIYSPSGADIESSEEFETARIDFHGPVELINLNNQLRIDRSRRYEAGFSHVFEDRSRFETAFFFDKMINHTVGLLSVPTEAELKENDPEAEGSVSSAIEQRGVSRGVRVVYTRPLTKNISTSFGYAYGQGQKLGPSSDGRPSFSVGYFQVFTGKLDAQFVRTGTHISTVVRLASPHAVFAIDPFQQRLGPIDPNISIYIAQSLPMFDFIPGRWEANVDARNLLDSNSGDDRTRLAIGQYWRSIRGGFSVRF